MDMINIKNGVVYINLEELKEYDTIVLKAKEIEIENNNTGFANSNFYRLYIVGMKDKKALKVLSKYDFSNLLIITTDYYVDDMIDIIRELKRYRKDNKLNIKYSVRVPNTSFGELMMNHLKEALYL